MVVMRRRQGCEVSRDLAIKAIRLGMVTCVIPHIIDLA